MLIQNRFLKVLGSGLVLITIFAGTFFYLSAIEEGITLEQDRIQMVNLERLNNRDSFTGVFAVSELHSWERENLQAVYSMFLRLSNGIELNKQVPRVMVGNPNPVRVFVVGDSFVWGAWTT